MVTMFINGDKNTITKNTIENVQASATVTPGERSIFSYNKVTKTGALQSDGSVFQGTRNFVADSEVHHNYVYNTPKLALRYDAPGDDPTAAGQRGKMYNNVAINTSGIMVKGDYHYISNNTVIGSNKNGMIILDEENSNLNTFTQNNLVDKLSGHRSLSIYEDKDRDGNADFPIPGNNSNNWNGWDSVNTNYNDELSIDNTIYTLIDSITLMPLEGSPLIDAGISIESIPQEIVGSAPDIGAYEYGAEKWEAGIEGWVPDFYPWSFIIDTDGDGILDTKDNCPEIYNPDQRDVNNNSIGDFCDDELPDPENMHFELTEIQSDNSLSDLVQPYLINNDYEEFFNQGFDIVDFDNDGKLDYATVFYETKREINKAGLGIFSFDIGNDELTIDLDNVIEINGEPNANAPDINYLDNDEILDVFVPTGNYHGEPGTEPDFYNGTSNRPDFLYYNIENSFKVDSLDYTYNSEKYANSSVQKTIQIDEDKSREIAILTYEGAIQGKGAMAIYDYNYQTNRHELVNEIFTSNSQDGDERFNDIHNIDFNGDGLIDLLSIHSQKSHDLDKYYVNIYYGRQHDQSQIDFNSKELIAIYTEDNSEWFIAENEEYTSVIEMGGRHILFVQYAGKDGSSAKLVAYDLSTKNAFDITSYLFGKEFINRNFDGLGHYWEDIDNDDDLDLIVERLAYPTIFIQNQGRFHPVKFDIELDESDRPFIWIDFNQDSKYDIISVKSLKHYLAGTIMLDSDEDGVADAEDNCPDTPAGEVADINGCSDSQKDSDGDGVNDDIDNCPNIYDPDQADWNNNGVGDVCGDPKPLFTERSATLVENIYPNPTDDKLRVSLKPGLEIRDLYFVDFSGKSIKPKSVGRNRDNLDINVSNLNEGIYILEIITDKEVDKVKIVIERNK